MMAHELEMVNGKVCFAYAGEVPWHGLGVKVPADLTPAQMLEKAGLDWEVEKVPAFAEVAGEKIDVGKSALVRTSDNRVLDVVGNDWNPLQNVEAFEFFNDFVMAGEMEMHTAGSLLNGKRVWALAKVSDSFELFGGRDRVDNYLLFSNPHEYGMSIDIRMTPIRVVCNNTLTVSLRSGTKNGTKVSHRVQFDAETVKETMGLAEIKMDTYKEMAEFISTKRFTEENKVEYLERLFPVLGEAKRKKQSKGASNILELLDTQPGAELGEGTFWQLYNGVTYYVDHQMGRTDDNRMNNAWFGSGVKKKQDALDLALEMAEVA
jgi:phage/plasmid-like protein (TIGR03299 family)